MGAPNMPRGGRPPQNCLLLTLTLSAGRCPQPVLAAFWDCGATLGPWEEEGGRSPFPSPQALCEHSEDPALGGSPWVLGSGPHLAVFQPLAPPWAWGSRS